MASKDDKIFDEAKQWLIKAVTFDGEDKLIEAFCCYKEGLSQLMSYLKSVPDSEPQRKTKIRERLNDFMGRAEVLKEKLTASGVIARIGGRNHTQYKISEGERGYGYERIFADCLTGVVWVRIEDAYIRKPYQIHFFVQFCELLVMHCPCLQQIELRTGTDESEPQKQRENLNSVSESLAERSVKLKLEFSNSLHDREIFFSNGWRVKIGRGLALYQKNISLFSLGQHQLALRQCFETTVDVFHESVLL